MKWGRDEVAYNNTKRLSEKPSYIAGKIKDENFNLLYNKDEGGWKMETLYSQSI